MSQRPRAARKKAALRTRLICPPSPRSRRPAPRPAAISARVSSPCGTTGTSIRSGSTLTLRRPVSSASRSASSRSSAMRSSTLAVCRPAGPPSAVSAPRACGPPDRSARGLRRPASWRRFADSFHLRQATSKWRPPMVIRTRHQSAPPDGFFGAVVLHSAWARASRALPRFIRSFNFRLAFFDQGPARSIPRRSRLSRSRGGAGSPTRQSRRCRSAWDRPASALATTAHRPPIAAHCLRTLHVHIKLRHPVVVEVHLRAQVVQFVLMAFSSVDPVGCERWLAASSKACTIFIRFCGRGAQPVHPWPSGPSRP